MQLRLRRKRLHPVFTSCPRFQWLVECLGTCVSPPPTLLLGCPRDFHQIHQQSPDQFRSTFSPSRPPLAVPDPANVLSVLLLCTDCFLLRGGSEPAPGAAEAPLMSIFSRVALQAQQGLLSFNRSPFRHNVTFPLYFLKRVLPSCAFATPTHPRDWFSRSSYRGCTELGGTPRARKLALPPRDPPCRPPRPACYSHQASPAQRGVGQR